MNALVSPLAQILSLVLLAMGVLGFVLGSPLIVFEAGVVHNVLRLTCGCIGLLALGLGYRVARAYLVALGSFFGLVAVLGLAQQTTVLGLVRASLADHLFHLGIALVCLFVGLGSRRD